MAGCLLPLTENEGVNVSGPALRRLLDRGDGDAALLYLALLQHRGTVPPRSLAGALRWDRSRIEGAEGVLRELGLLAREEPEPPAPADERPSYQPEDVARSLEGNPEFRNLVEAVEQRLGKRLSTPDTQALLGLYDYLGLPADVLYLLVCHCAERTAHRLGEGRRPGMKMIEREGYAWARMGIDTQEAAAEYLKTYARRQGAVPQYMRALALPDRPPSASEEKYILSWQEMGFGPEAVALACDKTMLHCHELKWPYCNGILKNWHAAGLHTPEEIERGDRPGGPEKPPASDGRDDVTSRYVQQLRRNRR